MLPDIPNVSFKMFKPPNPNPKNCKYQQWERKNGPWNLTDYQAKTTIKYVKGWRRMILGDETDVGKTVTALSCFCLARIKKVLIVCQKILIRFWWQHLKILAAYWNKDLCWENLVKVLDWTFEETIKKRESKEEELSFSMFGSFRKAP